MMTMENNTQEVKICLYSDTHLKSNDTLGSMVDGINSRLQQKLDILTTVKDIALKRGCKAVVDLGDTFDTTNPPNFVRNLYALKVGEMIGQGLQYVKICGNHETAGGNKRAGGPIHSVGWDTHLLANTKNFKVITEPKIVRIADIDFLCIPEVPAPKHIRSMLKKYPKHICFGHFEVKGSSKYASGIKSTTGIPAAIVKTRALTLLGHIHTRQQLFRGKIHHIGCVARTNYNDADTPAGVCILTVNTSTYKTKVEYVDIFDIDLLSLPITEGKPFPTNHKVKKGPNGFIMRLVITGTREWIASQQQEIEELRKQLLSQGAIKIRLKVELIPTGKTISNIKQIASDFDGEKLIRTVAKKDKRNAAEGVRYLDAGKEATVE